MPTKEIDQIIDPTPLPQPLVELGQWMSTYYATPLATVLQTILPRGITKKRREKAASVIRSVRERTNFVFTDDQQSALDILADKNRHRPASWRHWRR